MSEELQQGAFVIRKIHSAYLVSIVEYFVSVRPMIKSSRVAASITIASSMQTIGNSKLQLNHPKDPCQFLMDYYQDLGWIIEIAD